MELSDIARARELAAARGRARSDARRGRRRRPRCRDEPGHRRLVLLFEHLWAAPVGSAMRRAGGQLIVNGRIPDPGHHRRHRGRRGASKRKEPDMPLDHATEPESPRAPDPRRRWQRTAKRHVTGSAHPNGRRITRPSSSPSSASLPRSPASPGCFGLRLLGFDWFASWATSRRSSRRALGLARDPRRRPLARRRGRPLVDAPVGLDAGHGGGRPGRLRGVPLDGPVPRAAASASA